MLGGGSKPGERRGGRKRGTKNKATVERELRAETGVRSALEDGLMPLDVILRVMRGGAGSGLDMVQYSAAVAAAPYCHPRLAAVARAGKDGELTLEELVMASLKR